MQRNYLFLLYYFFFLFLLFLIMSFFIHFPLLYIGLYIKVILLCFDNWQNFAVEIHGYWLNYAYILPMHIWFSSRASLKIVSLLHWSHLSESIVVQSVKCHDILEGKNNHSCVIRKISQHSGSQKKHCCVIRKVSQHSRKKMGVVT